MVAGATPSTRLHAAQVIPLVFAGIVGCGQHEWLLAFGAGNLLSQLGPVFEFEAGTAVRTVNRDRCHDVPRQGIVALFGRIEQARSDTAALDDRRQAGQRYAWNVTVTKGNTLNVP